MRTEIDGQCPARVEVRLYARAAPGSTPVPYTVKKFPLEKGYCCGMKSHPGVVFPLEATNHGKRAAEHSTAIIRMMDEHGDFVEQQQSAVYGLEFDCEPGEACEHQHQQMTFNRRRATWTSITSFDVVMLGSYRAAGESRKR